MITIMVRFIQNAFASKFCSLDPPTDTDDKAAIEDEEAETANEANIFMRILRNKSGYGGSSVLALVRTSKGHCDTR